MILFERSDHAAVVARVVVLDHERLPLLSGEEALRALTQRTVLLTLRSDDIGMCAVVRSNLSLQAVRVSRVASPALSPMLLGVRFPPTLHARTGLLGIALHPFAAVGPPPVRICVRHRALRTFVLSSKPATSSQ